MSLSGTFDQRKMENFADDCELVTRIVVGCENSIYKYRHRSTGIICAVKQHSASDGARVELEVLKKIDNDRIIKYFDHLHVQHEAERDDLLIFMELADKNLLSYIMQVGAIKNAIIFRSIAAQLVEGVCVLHSEGIVHRDLSYYNILVKGNAFEISDFDVAAFSNNLTAQVGYIGINPPEMILCQKYDEKVDVWGLGCMLYFIANGQLPFEHTKNHGALISDIIEKVGFPKHFIQAAAEKKLIRGIGNFSIKLPFIPLLADIGLENWDLIYNCLKSDPQKRPTAFELFDHPTFYEYFNYQMIPYVA